MAATGDFSHRDLHVTIHLSYFAGYGWLGENILVGPKSVTGNAMEDAWVWATQDFGGPHG